MNAEQIVGRLTQEETAAVLRECMRALPWEMLAPVLSEELTLEQLDELNASLP
jgi:hypothetical protein